MRPHSLLQVPWLLCLIYSDSASAFRRRPPPQKRLDITEVIPAPVVVPPSQYWDGDDGQWSSFALRVGSPAQNVRVLVSTNSPQTMVVLPQGCTTLALNPVPPNCANSRGGIFDPNASPTWQAQGRYGINGNGVGLEANLGYVQTGDYGLETVGLGFVAGTTNGPTLLKQTVAAIATKSPFYTGILGLSTQPVNYSTIGNSSSPSFFSTLRSQKLIPSLSWSYTAGAKYRLKSGQQAQLIFGGYDTSRFAPNSASLTLADDVDRDLVVAIQSITYSGSTQSNLLAAPIFAFVESTDTNIWLPEAACQAFEKAFGLSLDNKTGLYLINATYYSQLQAANPQVTFTISNSLSGGQTVNIVLPFSAFALSASYPFVANDTYYIPLKKATNDTQYTLGRTFFQEAYLTVDYERGNFSLSQCLWMDGAAPQIAAIISADYIKTTTTTTTPDDTKPASKHISTGIVAGIPAGVLAIVAIGLLTFFLIRRRRQRVVSLTPTENITLTNISKADEDKKHRSSFDHGNTLPGYKKHDSGADVYRKSVHSELPSTGEIHQLHGNNFENSGDYFTAVSNMKENMRATNTHEIDGRAVVYEMPGDSPLPIEMDDERSRSGLLSPAGQDSRPSTRGSSKSRSDGPVPTTLT